MNDFLQAIEDHLCAVVVVFFVVAGIIGAVKGQDWW